jgi:SAM-dependent methyltransferase
MREKLLDYLCCPRCRADLSLLAFDAAGDEVVYGLLYCPEMHCFPLVRGIPRMLPSSLVDHWAEIESKMGDRNAEPLKSLIEKNDLGSGTAAYDTRTKANFSNEWDNHDLGDRTWTMELDDRVKWFFLEPIHIAKEDLAGKVLLDAGCGNGSQSVAYTEFGLEVIAVDLSTGLEKGYGFRDVRPNAKPDKVHFIQADLQQLPLKDNIADIIHSAGVLHHTPNTERTFRAVVTRLKVGGTFYIWLYKYEKVVTPIVNSIRAVTTRLPQGLFAPIASLGALPFIGFCWTVNKLGIRQYETPDMAESVLALHDIFGAPYAHYHSFNEVVDWYASVGITDVWPVNDSRRGFGVCGRKVD